ncbi:ABC transporter permease [Nocardioides sp. NPDC047086]|uniref:ABC transporter permease n=1 Tax=Nocardioides sp. NPDC047086 TaxID=3154810 RepID=UPI0033C438E5
MSAQRSATREVVQNAGAGATTSGRLEGASVRMPKAQRTARISASTQERVMTFAAPVLFLLVWEALARVGILDVKFFPAPSMIIDQFGYELGPEGTLQYDTFVTLRRVLIGFLVGGVPAVVIGLCMGFMRPLRLLVDPVVSMLYALPKSAMMPLLMLILGFGESSKVALVALGVFFPVVVNCMAGVRGIQSVYVDVATNYGASTLQYLRFVAMPGALPLMLSGLRIGLAQGIILVAVAELVGAREGLGYMIQHAWELQSVRTMYVALFTIGIIGIVSSLVLRELEQKLVAWTRRD